MKKYNNIDELFKEGASDFRVTPSEKVWENIESAHSKIYSFKKRNVLLLAIISLLLISGSFITWTLLTNNPNQNNLVPDKVTADENNINTNSTIIINKAENENNTIQKTETITNNNESSLIIEDKKNTSKPTPAEDETVRIPKYYSNNESKTNAFLFADNETLLFASETSQLSKISTTSTSTLENNCTPSIINDFDKITIDEYLEKRKHLHFYTGASASIAMAYYSSTTDQSTWTTDLVYGLKLKRFYIETGIGFQKMKEHGNFQIDYITNDSIGYYNEVTSFELNPDNPNEITYKTQTTTVYDSIKHYVLRSPLYHYDYIVIPLKFGYKFYQKHQLSVSVETGIIYSLLTKTYTPEVQYNDPESELIEITNNTPERIEHNFRIHIALRINYNITRSISFNVQPEFTSFINSIYKQSNNSKVRPYTMGLRMGICFDF